MLRARGQPTLGERYVAPHGPHSRAWSPILPVRSASPTSPRVLAVSPYRRPQSLEQERATGDHDVPLGIMVYAGPAPGGAHAKSNLGGSPWGNDGGASANTAVIKDLFRQMDDAASFPPSHERQARGRHRPSGDGEQRRQSPGAMPRTRSVPAEPQQRSPPIPHGKGHQMAFAMRNRGRRQEGLADQIPSRPHVNANFVMPPACMQGEQRRAEQNRGLSEPSRVSRHPADASANSGPASVQGEDRRAEQSLSLSEPGPSPRRNPNPSCIMPPANIQEEHRRAEIGRGYRESGQGLQPHDDERFVMPPAKMQGEQRRAEHRRGMSEPDGRPMSRHPANTNESTDPATVHREGRRAEQSGSLNEPARRLQQYADSRSASRSSSPHSRDTSQASKTTYRSSAQVRKAWPMHANCSISSERLGF